MVVSLALAQFPGLGLCCAHVYPQGGGHVTLPAIRVVSEASLINELEVVGDTNQMRTVQDCPSCTEVEHFQNK